jgi:aryl-alcohol dehydrogenase-like predicted oxidoreductase
MLLHRTLGRTGLRVSPIALGTVALGLEYGIPTGPGLLKPHASDAERLLNRALDLGVNLIDTARAYGESETIIGQALASRRQEFVLASKVSSYPGEPHRVGESVRESLRQLRTDFLDLVQIHSGASDKQPDPDTTGALLELKSAGVVRAIGASVYGEEAAAAAVRSGSFDTLQVAASALDRRLEASLLPAAQSARVGVLARSVLLKGALTDRWRYLPEQLASLKGAVQQLERLCGGEVASLPELAYRYALSVPSIDSVLAGVTSESELESALRWAARGPLSPELLTAIRALESLPNEILTPAFWPAL